MTNEEFDNTSLKEFEIILSRADKDVNKAAQRALNNIHFLLLRNLTKKEKLEKIVEAEEKYKNVCDKYFSISILKYKKLKQLEDPIAFARTQKELDELDKKYKQKSVR